QSLSRRSFAQLLGAGTVAAAATPSLSLLARPAAVPSVVRLSANENPYGPSAATLRAATEALQWSALYPDRAVDLLQGDVASLHGLSTDEVVLGCGSSEILKIASLAYVDAKRKLVMADPTFEAIGHYTRPTGAEVVKVPLTRDYAHDLPRMLEAARGAGLVYVCNPNNPTATITPKNVLREFLDALPASTVVLVDEAYHHYAESPRYESVAPLVKSKPNLIVARTFSKVYAMAGLRCGYALAQKPVIDSMFANMHWDSLNIVVLRAARAALNDKQHVAVAQKRNREAKAWLTRELESMGHPVLPSEANFVMVDTGRDVRPLIASMRERGVQVGRLFPAMPQHMRVTVGKPEELQRFAEAFRQVVA
ncbi:MAG TPA: aminotransferase class I/II-fold pyridoxal phosphate-dependent enzyme, partial [Thermoanaerobaculia bacterium]|nr:aminotransferase class I/II-fold pyridoxal phosphate-dependent enzyme [Thermoanaerobaculia bacterium]